MKLPPACHTKTDIHTSVKDSQNTVLSTVSYLGEVLLQNSPEMPGEKKEGRWKNTSLKRKKRKKKEIKREKRKGMQ